jgi:hypothetical protein
MIVNHPTYPDLEVDLSDNDYPDYDDTASCYGLPVNAFFYNSTHDEEEPWTEKRYKPKKARISPTGKAGFIRLSVNYTTLDSMLAEICQSCPFVSKCFAHAMAHEEYGFWGGTTAGQRKYLREKLGAGFDWKNFYKFNDVDARRIASLIASVGGVVDDGDE